MKQVLVWTSYGEVDVHPADTAEDFQKIIATVLEIVGDWNVEDEAIDFANKVLEETPDDLKKLTRAFGFLAQSGILTYEDSFETFELVEVKKL